MSTHNIGRHLPFRRLGLTFALGLVLIVGLLWLLSVASPHGGALAQGSTVRYVAPSPAGNDNSNNCTNSSTPCATVQHAVDVADPGDEIRVATGTYTELQARAGITQLCGPVPDEPVSRNKELSAHKKAS